MHGTRTRGQPRAERAPKHFELRSSRTRAEHGRFSRFVHSGDRRGCGQRGQGAPLPCRVRRDGGCVRGGGLTQQRSAAPAAPRQSPVAPAPRALRSLVVLCVSLVQFSFNRRIGVMKAVPMFYSPPGHEDCVWRGGERQRVGAAGERAGTRATCAGAGAGRGASAARWCTSTSGRALWRLHSRCGLPRERTGALRVRVWRRGAAGRRVRGGPRPPALHLPRAVAESS